MHLLSTFTFLNNDCQSSFLNQPSWVVPSTLWTLTTFWRMQNSVAEKLHWSHSGCVALLFEHCRPSNVFWFLQVCVLSKQTLWSTTKDKNLWVKGIDFMKAKKNMQMDVQEVWPWCTIMQINITHIQQYFIQYHWLFHYTFKSYVLCV